MYDSYVQKVAVRDGMHIIMKCAKTLSVRNVAICGNTNRHFYTCHRYGDKLSKARFNMFLL